MKSDKNFVSSEREAASHDFLKVFECDLEVPEPGSEYSEYYQFPEVFEFTNSRYQFVCYIAVP